jgi:hypothetical protein
LGYCPIITRKRNKSTINRKIDSPSQSGRVSSNTIIAIVIAIVIATAIVLFRLVGLICMLVPLYFVYLQALQGHFGSYIECAGLGPRAFSSIGEPGRS